MTLLAAFFIFATAATLFAWARACRQRDAAIGLAAAAESRARKLGSALKFADTRINHERDTNQRLTGLYATTVRDLAAAAVDAEWASILVASLQADADMHAANHACLPTLAGIRAGV